MAEQPDDIKYIVICGGVARCRTYRSGGQIVHAPAAARTASGVRAVFRDGRDNREIEDYLFSKREEAQRSILNRTVDPTALTWNNESGERGRPRIYLAGFHVFRPDWGEYGPLLREKCAAYGFEGLSPMDNEPFDNLDGPGRAAMIFYLNEGLIREADIVMADLNPFRGHEPDSGTVFECGFGYALGKKVYGYISDGRSMREKLEPGIDARTGTFTDGMTVENFDLPLNLMLSVPLTVVVGGPEECLARIKVDMEKEVEKKKPAARRG